MSVVSPRPVGCRHHIVLNDFLDRPESRYLASPGAGIAALISREHIDGMEANRLGHVVLARARQLMVSLKEL
jgi:hypothetical protein